MSDAIIKIERELFEKGVLCEWRFVQDVQHLPYFVWTFTKGFTTIETKLSRWNVEENANNIIHVISMFFEHSEIVFKPNKV